MKSMFFLTLITTIIIGASSNECLLENSTSEDVSAFFVKTIDVEVSDGVTLTWQAARGATNISIWVTDDLILTTDDVIDGILTIRAQLYADVTTEDAIPTTEDAATTTEDAPPTTEDAAPTTEDVAPTTEDDTPTTEDNAPTTEDDAPTTEDAAVTTDDVTVFTDDVTVFTDDVTATTDSGSGSGSRFFTWILLFSSALFFFTVDGQKKWSAILVLVLASLFTLSSTEYSTNCNTGKAIHIQIPTNMVEQMCVNSVCRPLICKLSQFSEYSNIPSNNRIIFSDDQCTIKKPDFWDAWLVQYFGDGTTQDYYGDFDGDGLVNVLEYYGPEAFEGNFVTDNQEVYSINKVSPKTNKTPKMKRHTSSLKEMLDEGTDPLEFDCDGDLIPDGRERYYETDPRQPDPIDTDDDNDGLNTLDEQIHSTDPMNGDSDGDGTKDGEEVEQGSDARDPTDQGKPDECKQTAKIKITIGDHSGSHSERYEFILGDVAQQAPEFGVVTSGEYVFQSGTYTGIIRHMGTNLEEGPDCDYTARLEKVSGDATVVISDPDGMLGVHDDDSWSTPLYSEGKSVTVTVELDCESDPENPCCDCGQFSRCEDCQTSTEPDCVWDVKKKTCKPKGLFDSKDTCPCTACDDWYQEELADSDWRHELNEALPCPCEVEIHPFWITPVDDPSGRNPDWDADWACVAHGMPACNLFHPGASGCLRSTDAEGIGRAQQQCCYSSDGSVITSGQGAGTPDRDSCVFGCGSGGHSEADVEPYEWCCKECEVPEESCPKYNGPDGVRTGNYDHCP